MLPPAPLVLGRTEQEKKSAKHNLKIKGAPNSVRIAYSHREDLLYISIFLQLSPSPPPPNKYICLTISVSLTILVSLTTSVSLPTVILKGETHETVHLGFT
jgi:hypothetical protein